LSSEEKTNDYENFEKGMIYMKTKDSREKGGGGNDVFLHFLPCLQMALSYQTVSKTLT
jgi:hypothetical protein